MALSDDLLDRTLIRETRWVRFATSVSMPALTRIAEADATLEAYLRQRLAHLSTGPIVLGKHALKLLASIMAGVRERTNKTFAEIFEFIRTRVIEAGLSELALYSASVGEIAQKSVTRPERRRMRKVLTGMQVNGLTLSKGLRQIQASRMQLVEQGIRIGAAMSETGEQIARRLFGTTRLRFQDGMLNRTRRALDGFIHDAIATAVSRARELFVRTNARLFPKQAWTSRLDHKVCPICGSLHGRIYDVGKGPEPPVHLGCRCVRTPIIDEPPADESFTGWLQRQSTEIQNDVLGRTRADLWRSGRVKFDRFVKDNRILTLAELERREGFSGLIGAAA